MFSDPNGPIEQFSWGKFIICRSEHSETDDVETGAGKDIRLIGTQVTEWSERKGHLLTPAMITGIAGLGIEVLVIGIGVDGALQCPEAMRQSILDSGISEVILARTPEACAKYNALYRQNRQVAFLAHGTC